MKNPDRLTSGNETATEIAKRLIEQAWRKILNNEIMWFDNKQKMSFVYQVNRYAQRQSAGHYKRRALAQERLKREGDDNHSEIEYLSAIKETEGALAASQFLLIKVLEQLPSLSVDHFENLFNKIVTEILETARNEGVLTGESSEESIHLEATMENNVRMILLEKFLNLFSN